MDIVDAKILKMLAEDASVTTVDIMNEVNLSAPAVNKRILKLRKSGVIKQYTVLIDSKKIDKPIQAFVLIVLHHRTGLEELVSYVQNDIDILECYAVSGEYDYLLKVCAKSIEALEDKLLCLKEKKGVVKTHTMISLLEYKCQPTALPEID